MKIKRVGVLFTVIVMLTTTGCASHRVSSNIDSNRSSVSLSPDTPVIIAVDSLPGREYKEIGPVEVSVKKLTAFHKDPTKEQANEALKERARVIGADAVVDVTYESGVGMMTWGYLDAKGRGVKLTK